MTVGGNDHNESLDKLLYTSQQLESFIICSYPSNTSSEDQEVQLLKLAHNFFPEINIEYYSRGVRIILKIYSLYNGAS